MRIPTYVPSSSTRESMSPSHRNGNRYMHCAPIYDTYGVARSNEKTGRVSGRTIIREGFLPKNQMSDERGFKSRDWRYSSKTTTIFHHLNVKKNSDIQKNEYEKENRRGILNIKHGESRETERDKETNRTKDKNTYRERLPCTFTVFARSSDRTSHRKSVGYPKEKKEKNESKQTTRSSLAPYLGFKHFSWWKTNTQSITIQADDEKT